MATSDLLIRLDGSSAGLTRAMSQAEVAAGRLEKQTALLATAQADLNKVTAEYGASSAEATAAANKVAAAQGRVEKAQLNSAIASKKAAERQIADANAAAAAQERAAAKQEAALKKVGSAYGLVGLAAGAALVGAAKAAADFNAKIAQVQSLTRASAGTVQRLADATKNYANLGVSASQAADAEIELVKAGISAKDILGGALSGTVKLAAAGQLDLGDATSIAAQAMTQFQLSGKDIPHLADLLAAGADKALGSVQDLGEGLKYSGLTAHQAGLSINETVGVLSEFAQAGLIGSQGGTALQQVLRQLLAPTATAAGLIQKLGLNLYDAQGNFKGLASFAGQLQNALKGMSQEQQQATLNTLFTSRAVRGATVLFQDGAKGVNSWTQKVNQAGFAGDQASGKMDSLNGDLEKLRAEATNLAIDFGQKLQPSLRTATQDLTSLLHIVGGLPDPVKQGAVQLLALTTAVGAGVFVYTRAKTALSSLGQTLGVVATREGEAGAAATLTNTKMLAMRGGAAIAGVALLGLKDDAAKTNETLGILTGIAGDAALGFAAGGPWGAAIGAGVGALQALSSASGDASVSVKSLTDTLNQNTGAWTANSDVAAKSTALKVSDQLTAAGISVQTYTHALLGNKTAIDAVNTAIERSSKITGNFAGNLSWSPASFSAILGPLQDVQDAQQKLRENFAAQVALTTQKLTPAQEKLANETRAMGGAMSDTAGDVVKVGNDVKATGDKTESAAKQTQDLADKMQTLDNRALQLRGGFRGYQAALDDATASLKTNGQTLDINTSKGRANASALDQVAQSALDAEKNMKGAALVKFNNDAHDKLVALAESFGMSTQGAQNYADRVLHTMNPATDQATKHLNATTDAAQTLGKQQPNVKVTADTGTATAAMAKFERDANTALGHISNETVSVNVVPSAAQVNKVSAQLGLATGGYVSGPGGPTSDSIPAWLSNGEFVINAAAVQAYGVGLLHAINARRFAEGGEVSNVAPTVGVSVDAGSMAPVASAIQSFADAAASKFGDALSKKAAAQAAKSGLAGNLPGGSGVPVGNGLFKPANGPVTQGLHDQWTGFPAIDIGVPIGTPIRAGHSGRVTVSADIFGDQVGGYASYGRYMQIAGNGEETLYAHLSQRGFPAGAIVRGGQTIGLSGDTGNTFGAHLHFGSRPLSPYAFGYASGGYVGPRYARGGGVGGYSPQPRVVVQPAQFPRQLTLVVDGRPMTAFVREIADDSVQQASSYANRLAGANS